MMVAVNDTELPTMVVGVESKAVVVVTLAMVSVTGDETLAA
jgi:hypothetical protein